MNFRIGVFSSLLFTVSTSHTHSRCIHPNDVRMRKGQRRLTSASFVTANFTHRIIPFSTGVITNAGNARLMHVRMRTRTHTHTHTRAHFHEQSRLCYFECCPHSRTYTYTHPHILYAFFVYLWHNYFHTSKIPPTKAPLRTLLTMLLLPPPQPLPPLLLLLLLLMMMIICLLVRMYCWYFFFPGLRKGTDKQP